MQTQEEANLTIDDAVNSSVPFQHKTLEERAAAYAGKLSLDGEFDWGKPVGRERWE